jgi:hypothetical protein
VFLSKTSWRFDGQSSDFDVKKRSHKSSHNVSPDIGHHFSFKFDLPSSSWELGTVHVPLRKQFNFLKKHPFVIILLCIHRCRRILTQNPKVMTSVRRNCSLVQGTHARWPLISKVLDTDMACSRIHRTHVHWSCYSWYFYILFLCRVIIDLQKIKQKTVGRILSGIVKGKDDLQR